MASRRLFSEEAYDPYSYYYAAAAAAPALAPSYSQLPYYCYHPRPTTAFSLLDDDPYRSYYAAAAAPSYGYSQGPNYYHRPTTTFDGMLRATARAAGGDVSLPVSRERDAKRPEVPNKAPKNRKPVKKANRKRKHKHKKSTPIIHDAEPQVVKAAVAAVEDAWDLAELFAVAAEHCGEMEEKAAAAEMEEVHGELDVAEEAEPASDHKPDADAEWEIVKEEEEPAAADPAAAGVVDTGKLMEMVAALCERNAEQCALIGALVERMDALERALQDDRTKAASLQ